jgi:chemosensory pili system protein ChpA (sensor histidine kinase/response regulator)
MTYDVSSPAEFPQEQFDTGPLSWVIADIREAINQAGKKLSEALKQDEESRATSLLHAKNFLHQAHGALQIVDIDGVALLTESIEDVLERLQNGQLIISEEVVTGVQDAFHAVLRYLEDLLSGAPHQPVRLFPYYRTVLELKGAERIHPADLFFPTLVVQEKIPELTLSYRGSAPAYTGLRQRFEKLLLTVLTSKDVEAQLKAVLQMRDLIAEIDQVQTTPQAKAFWVVMRAFTEAVESARIQSEQYVKQILGRINLQIRRLVDGGTAIPERLLRDALFFIAQIKQPTPLVASIRQAYALENAVPADYDKKNYGRVAASALSAAKEQLTAVKNLWGRIANGEQGLAEKFSQKMKDLAETGESLSTPSLSKLLRELSGIARHVAHSEEGSKFGLELATSLLFVENALDQITRLPAHFQDRAEEITSRLLSAVSGDELTSQAAWMGEISREAQQRQTMHVLVTEMQTSLRQIEKNLDEYFRDHSQADLLKPVDSVLHQIGGALAILDQDDAMRAVEHTRHLVGQFGDALISASESEQNSLHQKVAQNIGALSFFIETIQSQPETAKKKFTFDADTGLFRSHLLESSSQKELLPNPDQLVMQAIYPQETVLTAEEELAHQQQESVRLAESLAKAPDDEAIREQLKHSLEAERSVATLLDDTEAGERAKAAMAALAQTDASEVPQLVAHATVPHAQVSAPVVMPESDDAIDAELLEIFLMEAEEVLQFVRDTLPLSRQDTDNQEYLTSLRRSFHTLKGSSRMVGLNVFGETAWSIEQVMNLWLSESRHGTDALYKLLDHVAAEMTLWVAELRDSGNSFRNGQAIVAAAQKLKAGDTSVELIAETEPAVHAEAEVVSAVPNQVIAEADTEPSDGPAQDASSAVESSLISEAVSSEISATEDGVGGQDETALSYDVHTEHVVEPLSDVAELSADPADDFNYHAEHQATSEPIPAAGELTDAVEDIQPEGIPALQTDSLTSEIQIDESATLHLSTESANLIDAEIEADRDASVAATDLHTEHHESPELSADDTDKFLSASEALEVATDGFVSEEIAAIANKAAESAEQSAEAAPEHEAEFSEELLAESLPSQGAQVEPEAEIIIPEEISVLEFSDEINLSSGVQSESVTAPDVVTSDELADIVVEEVGSDADAEISLHPEPEISGLASDETHDAALDELLAEQMPDPVVSDALPAELNPDTYELDASVAIVAETDTPETEIQSAESVVSGDDTAGTAQIIEFPDVNKPAIVPDDNVKRIGGLEISLPLYGIYMAETDEIVRFLTQDFSEWRHEPERVVSTHAIHASHSLAGSSATVGLRQLQELAHSMELVLQRLQRHPVVLHSSEFDVLDEALDTAKRMLQKFATSELPEAAPEQIQALEHLLQGIIARSDAGADEEFITSTNERLNLEDLEHLAQENGDVPEAPVMQEFVEVGQAETLAAIAPPEVSQPAVAKLNDEIDQDLLPVFIEEGQDLLPMVGELLRSWQEHPADGGIPQSIARLMHTIKGSARMAGAMTLGQHIHDMESRIESMANTGGAVRQPLLDDLLARHDLSMQMFDQLQNPQAYVAPEVPEVLTAAQELDRFQEELIAGAESAAPETKVPELVSLNPVVPVNTGAQVRAMPAAMPLNAPSQPGAPVPLVRVRADVLDRLVNQAGEVSISRSRLENEISTLRASLSELTGNVARLRDQLREVEIQAESQIAAQMSHAADRDFDPLEFDRFTRLQELTRMMAESVSDVATVQQNLNRTIDGASSDLLTQARLTRELQQDLMRVRMIPFASASERLYRVTRQTAKELDKRVNLDIRGAGVEMDRGVLEKMVGPFEHLLRNAIVHGIESREERRQAGKNETGELLIEIRQEGNEVVIRFKDDGRGLNLPSILNKARQSGLIGHDEQPGEAETAALIFEPGFTTASEVTELAGRGVGMDVVRSEASSLGGRVEVTTAAGQGAEFTIRLPLTLAVTQVVLLSAGGKTYAVPSVLVEQVQHLKANALASAYNEGAVMWQGQRVGMYFLSTLLADHHAAPMSLQYTPVLILKSGTDRVALHVDEILGNREVVVKNIGPQLARMAGIAGATVLGSGEIILILNPVPLAGRFEQLQLARLPHHEAEAVQGAVANLEQPESALPVASEPVQGLRKQHTVMVVDDSLTVRRVTQRLLTREGYQVILAKDGIDALEQLQSVTPDVMLVDIEMPRMDGFDLTRNVRSDTRTSHIPIIMITSRTADKHRNYAKELGVNEYFGKPYREDDLLEAIVRFIGQENAIIV